MKSQRHEKLSLPEATTHLLEECRMVLPGIQALFGFQLIAVFNSRFADDLAFAEQVLHLIAIALVALAVALVMAPAAYHRQVGPEDVSDEFIRMASRLMLWSMFPLMTGICLDFYLIARLIVNNEVISLFFSLVLFGIFAALWLLLPRSNALQRWLRRSS